MSRLSVPFAAGIKAARQPIVARTDEDRESFLRKNGLSKSETSKVVEAVYKILHLRVARCETDAPRKSSVASCDPISIRMTTRLNRETGNGNRKTDRGQPH